MTSVGQRLFILIMVFAVLCALVVSCTRGRVSEREPIHLNPNMDSQEKYKAQSEGTFFDNGSAMRMPVEGTVARGELHEDPVYFTGKDASGNFVEQQPEPVTMQSLKRGRERYDIYCAPCHGRLGNGRGIMVQYKLPPPPTFHVDSLRARPDGRIFDVITNGIRNMPSYRHQIPVKDRWAIIGYIRALQYSQNAEPGNLPKHILDSLKRGGQL